MAVTPGKATVGNPDAAAGSPARAAGNRVVGAGNPDAAAGNRVGAAGNPARAAGNRVGVVGNPDAGAGSPARAAGNPDAGVRSPVARSGQQRVAQRPKRRSDLPSVRHRPASARRGRRNLLNRRSGRYLPPAVRLRRLGCTRLGRAPGQTTSRSLASARAPPESSWLWVALVVAVGTGAACALSSAFLLGRCHAPRAAAALKCSTSSPVRVRALAPLVEGIR